MPLPAFVAPAIVIGLAALIGKAFGGNGNGKQQPGNDLPPKPGPTPQGFVPKWPRTVPQAGEVAIKNTWSGSPNDWRVSRYNAALAWLNSQGVGNASDVALSVTAHWDLETNAGSHEYNFNLGGINANQGQQYFQSTDVSDPTTPVAFCAYDTLDQGVSDYFACLALQRFAGCLEKLLNNPTSQDWFVCTGQAGWFANPTTLAPQWQMRRDAIAKLIAGGNGQQQQPQQQQQQNQPQPQPQQQQPNVATPAGWYTITADEVNIRSSSAGGVSSPTGTIIAQSVKDEIFVADGTTDNGFAHGTFTQVGWLASQYLTGSQPNLTTTGSGISLRTGPVQSAPAIALTGPKGQTFTGDGQTQDNYTHGTFSVTGWIAQKYLTPTQ